VVRFEVGPGLGGIEAYLINHPDLLKHVFQDNAKNYRKSVYYLYLQRVLGFGLLTSDGDRWLRNRRLVQPAFHRRHIDGFARVMVSHTRALLDRFETLARTGRPAEVTSEMSRLAFGIVGEALFGGDLDAREADEVARGLADAQHWFEGAVDAIVPLPSWFPTPSVLKMKRAVKTIDRTVYGAIADRRRANARGDARSIDLIQLLDARHEAGAALGRRAARRARTRGGRPRDHRKSALLGVHLFDGTRSASRSAKSEERARRSRSDRRRSPEALRPARRRRDAPSSPAWVLDRNANEDDEVGGHIPKDALRWGAWVMHRTAPWWTTPSVRSRPLRAHRPPALGHFPFGGGPRQCIGSHFAVMESVFAIAMIAARFEVKVAASATSSAPAGDTAASPARHRPDLASILASAETR
jgi:cytochrome P450